MNGTAAVFAGNKVVFRLAFHRDKAKASGIAFKDTGKKAALRLRIFSLFGHLNPAFFDKRVQHFLQIPTLALWHLQHNGYFLGLHRNVEFITDKLIYGFFPFFQ